MKSFVRFTTTHWFPVYFSSNPCFVYTIDVLGGGGNNPPSWVLRRGKGGGYYEGLEWEESGAGMFTPISIIHNKTEGCHANPKLRLEGRD